MKNCVTPKRNKWNDPHFKKRISDVVGESKMEKMWNYMKTSTNKQRHQLHTKQIKKNKELKSKEGLHLTTTEVIGAKNVNK